MSFLRCLFATELGPGVNDSVKRVLIRLNIKIAISVQLVHPFQNLFRSHGCNWFSTASPRINNGVKDASRWSQPFMPSLLKHVVHVLKNRFRSSRSRPTFTTLGPCINWKQNERNKYNGQNQPRSKKPQNCPRTLSRPYLPWYTFS